MRYDLLSKQKLPALKQIDVTKTLSLPRNSSAFPEDTLRKIIIAKYIKNYDLYKCIYQFYWQLICEKKVHYPLTELLGVVLQQAIKYESFPF